MVKADTRNDVENMESLTFGLICRGALCLCTLALAQTLLENWKRVREHHGDQNLVYRYLEKYVKAGKPRNIRE